MGAFEHFQIFLFDSTFMRFPHSKRQAAVQQPEIMNVNKLVGSGQVWS